MSFNILRRNTLLVSHAKKISPSILRTTPTQQYASFSTTPTSSQSSATSTSTTGTGTGTGSSQRYKTGLMMLNMGGPEHPEETEFFLTNLFRDPELIPLGRFQDQLGGFVARRRTPRIRKQYEDIGGSPIRKWTEHQGAEMCRILDRISPASAPHKHYIAFRYAHPLTEPALEEMRQDGIEHAIAFSQYPQFSCTTSGSSLNHLWRVLKNTSPVNAGQSSDSMKWSVIDRWYQHPTYIDAVVARIEKAVEKYYLQQEKISHPSELTLLFSAHSLPVKVITRGDPYAHEIHSTVALVMQRLQYKFRWLLSWQSKVGYLPWLTPSTSSTIENLGKQGYKNLLVVPIAFTSDHIETLFEIDIEYAHLAQESGITNFHRVDGLNDEPLLPQALASIAADHIKQQEAAYSKEYAMNCIECVNPMCRTIMNPIAPYENMRSSHRKQGKAAKRVPIDSSDENVKNNVHTAEAAANLAAATPKSNSR